MQGMKAENQHSEKKAFMKITKSGHRKARLINQKMVQEKFMKNVYNYIV